MTKYGRTAITAVRLFTTGLAESPRAAWSTAARDIFGPSTSSAEKGCPRDAFLGLCEEGLVRGIPAGQYTRSEKNKRYALDALTVLRRNPELATHSRVLWDVVMGDEAKVHNGQMDVVTALWEQGLVVLRAGER